MTASAYVALPVVWIVVLVLSALAKARQVEETHSALQAFPLPNILKRRAVAVALPIGELILALGLLLSTGWVFVVSATSLLALSLVYFSLVLAILRRGEGTSCACFGALSGGEVTKATLVRNGLLAAGAAITVFRALAGGSVWGTLREFGSEEWTWLAVLTWTGALAALLGLRQQVHGSYERRPIPDATLIGPDGPVTVRELASTQARLLVFLPPNCAPCTQDRVRARGLGHAIVAYRGACRRQG